jgi:SNF2 family DNA or RNA helicase
MERHRCNECGQFYTEAKRCEGLVDQFTAAYENLDSERPSPALSSSSNANANARATAKAKAKKSKINNWLQMNGEVLPSAKTLAVKAQVLEWISEDPDVKIICYSQFIPMLHILGRICKTEKWEFEKYTGCMSHDARDKAIKNFGDPKKNIRILLASLKCGGLGLNLTMASRVITVRTRLTSRHNTRRQANIKLPDGPLVEPSSRTASLLPRLP